MIKNKAFTLIELLIVFAVIGLLAGIILASVKGFQTRATISKTLQYGKSVDNLLAADAVGIWNFDDQTNPTKDTSGWANHGTVNGATFTDDTPHKAAGAGAGKYALSFDGSNDYVDCGNNPSLYPTGSVTLEGWFKHTGENGYIFSNWWGSGWRGINFGVYAGAAQYLAFTIGSDTPAQDIVNAGSKYNDGEWHHAVGVYDQANLKLKIFVDGVLKQEKTTTITSVGYGNNNAAHVTIGAIDDGTGYRLNGLIDEVRVFSRALSQTEIRKLYAEGAAGHGIVLK